MGRAADKVKEEGRRKKEEGRRKKEQRKSCPYSFIPATFFPIQFQLLITNYQNHVSIVKKRPICRRSSDDKD
ncbi:hypothetical protein [Microcoleus sp. PH2017_02_FOX_O_A]|uniref:hypothetical protein n=1 Tax=Microcoleus sp. PH2017_02_FOX_O_A TaxID=2798813 RepID=UPI001D1BAB09|nr:hypothetical protein [Microcoleus sp. PH2017_02_FOX_O_A]MCC3440280.1 hypothetical protein [Microcoleus sp. PH2017_03_ELD_O_A]